MHIGSSSLRSARSVLGAPPPCEACAARQGVPLPAWGEARHSCTRARRAATTGRLEAPPPTLPWRAAARAQFVRSTGRPTRPSVAASMKHHLRMHCPLVEYNLLVLTSVPDPIINVSALDHSRCNQQRLCTCARSLCGARTADPPVGGLGMDRGRMKHAVPPRRRGPVSTTRHGERQSHVTKRSTWRNDDSARPDSDTTAGPPAPGTGTRPLPEAGTYLWRD